MTDVLRMEVGGKARWAGALVGELRDYVRAGHDWSEPGRACLQLWWGWGVWKVRPAFCQMRQVFLVPGKGSFNSVASQ